MPWHHKFIRGSDLTQNGGSEEIAGSPAFSLLSLQRRIIFVFLVASHKSKLVQ